MSQNGDDEKSELLALIKSEWPKADGRPPTTIVQGITPAPLLRDLAPSTSTAATTPSSGSSGAPTVEPDESPVVRRFRAPFDATNRHDARNDAISICYDYLIQRRMPIWAAHALARQFVDHTAVADADQSKSDGESLHVGRLAFIDDNYERIEAYGWCRRLLSRFALFMHDVATGVQLLPGKRLVSKRPQSSPFLVDKPFNVNQWPFAYTGVKNRKPKMEDRHLVVPTLCCIQFSSDDHHDDAFFAVFDGHNGHETAAYLAAHFHFALIDQIEGQQEVEDANTRLRRAYKLTECRLNIRAEHDHWRSGSTAAGILLRERTASLFWCGDASIGVLTANMIQTLSRPHLPSDADEYRRVEESGGTIVNVGGDLRVNGVLNITRSLGDLAAKPMISSEPEFSTRPLADDDYLLFVASDGVWDELSNDEILDACITYAKRFETQDYQWLSDHIVGECRCAGSRDNMTLIIIFCQPVEAVWQHLRSLSTADEQKTAVVGELSTLNVS